MPVPNVGSNIETFVRRGCYACLEEAFAAAAAAGRHDAAFETALLLALRSKELGLPHAPWIARARARLPEGPDWQPYLDMVLSVPADPLSGDRDELLRDAAAYRKPREILEGWRRLLAGGPGSSLFRAYLDVTLACGPLLYNEREAAMDAAIQSFGNAPLMQYRVGACGRTAVRARAGARAGAGRRSLRAGAGGASARAGRLRRGAPAIPSGARRLSGVGHDRVRHRHGAAATRGVA